MRREKEYNSGPLDEEPPGTLDSNSTFRPPSESGGLKGLNSFCLIAREEVPSSTNNLFSFADVDRDAMVDMLFITRNDLSLHVYYNKLLNQQQLIKAGAA